MTVVKISSLIEDKAMLQEIAHLAMVLRLCQVNYLKNKNETNGKQVGIAAKNLDKQLELSLPKDVYEKLGLEIFGDK